MNRDVLQEEVTRAEESYSPMKQSFCGKYSANIHLLSEFLKEIFKVLKTNALSNSFENLIFLWLTACGRDSLLKELAVSEVALTLRLVPLSL